jgi:hypothetical protein
MFWSQKWIAGQILSCLDPKRVKIGLKLTKLQNFVIFVKFFNLAELDIYGASANEISESLFFNWDICGSKFSERVIPMMHRYLISAKWR